MNINPISSYNMNQVQSQKTKVEEKSFEETFKKAQENKDEEKLMDVCRQFEAVFVNMLLKNMRNTIQTDSFIQKSHGREIFEGMLDEQLSEEVAKGEGMGLAKQMYAQLSKYSKNSHEE
ncbi:rod-binding protein [Anaerophilus nitritogenes]|uniref:rod-binding protein n=1 Tax=Anaerophilus nitritogenes TaxID=2498136 RepID=UPI00101D6DB4|nr:rod-binding protein [Anaerophilus nitritogenes]